MCRGGGLCGRNRRLRYCPADSGREGKSFLCGSEGQRRYAGAGLFHFRQSKHLRTGAFAAAAAGAGPVPYGEALAMEGHLRRYLLRGRHGHGHDLFPGKLGGAGCRYGGIRVPLETEADPSLYSAVRTGGALPAHHGAEPHPHHYQYGGLLHLQPGVSLQGGH